MLLMIQNDELVQIEDLTSEQRDDAISQCEGLLKVLKRGVQLTPEEFDRVADLIYESNDMGGQTVVDCDGWAQEVPWSKRRIVYYEDKDNPDGPSLKEPFQVSRQGSYVVAYFLANEQSWTIAELREQFGERLRD